MAVGFTCSRGLSPAIDIATDTIDTVLQISDLLLDATSINKCFFQAMCFLCNFLLDYL